MKLARKFAFKGLEKIVVASLFILISIGIAGFYIDYTWFKEVYIREDGFVENLTVVALLGITMVSIRRIAQLYKIKGRLFILCTALLAVLGLFGAGEEISWGQRILGIDSPEFFQQHNAQNETNLHNLVVNDTKINKLIFSKLLFIGLAFYTLVLPWLYGRYNQVKNLADNLAVPIPRLPQVVVLILIILSCELIQDGKKAELVELGSCFIFLLIVLYPANQAIFSPSPAKLSETNTPKAKQPDELSEHL